jgi:hypothetical protein
MCVCVCVLAHTGVTNALCVGGGAVMRVCDIQEQAFNDADSDMSGSLTLAEFRGMRGNAERNEEEVRAMFGKLDADGSGMVDLDQFLSSKVSRDQLLSSKSWCQQVALHASSSTAALTEAASEQDGRHGGLMEGGGEGRGEGGGAVGSSESGTVVTDKLTASSSTPSSLEAWGNLTRRTITVFLPSSPLGPQTWREPSWTSDLESLVEGRQACEDVDVGNEASLAVIGGHDKAPSAVIGGRDDEAAAPHEKMRGWGGECYRERRWSRVACRRPGLRRGEGAPRTDDATHGAELVLSQIAGLVAACKAARGGGEVMPELALRGTRGGGGGGEGRQDGGAGEGERGRKGRNKRKLLEQYKQAPRKGSNTSNLLARHVPEPALLHSRVSKDRDKKQTSDEVAKDKHKKLDKQKLLLDSLSRERGSHRPSKLDKQKPLESRERVASAATARDLSDRQPMALFRSLQRAIGEPAFLCLSPLSNLCALPPLSCQCACSVSSPFLPPSRPPPHPLTPLLCLITAG